MLRILAVFALTGGLFVNAQLDPACIREEDKKTLNDSVVALGISFAELISDNNVTGILEKICDDTTTRDKVNEIETLVKSCLPLIEVTTVKDLVLGDLVFTDLFERFSDVNNFCECRTSLVGLMTIEGVKNMMVLNNVDAAYTSVINFPFVCNASQAMLPSDYVKKSIVMLTSQATTCQGVFHYSTFVKSTNIVQMKGLVDMCEDNVGTEFNCAIDASKTQLFKTCINNADASTSDDAMDAKCERNKCAKKMACSDDAVKYFKWSVEVSTPNKFDNTNDCNGAGSLTTTVLLVLAAAIYSIFFAE